MELINYSCPSCNQMIKIDPSSDRQFCMKCGSEIRYRNPDLDLIPNLVKALKKKAMKEKREEALEIANRIMAIDPYNIDAPYWLGYLAAIDGCTKECTDLWSFYIRYVEPEHLKQDIPLMTRAISLLILFDSDNMFHNVDSVYALIEIIKSVDEKLNIPPDSLDTFICSIISDLYRMSSDNPSGLVTGYTVTMFFLFSYLSFLPSLDAQRIVIERASYAIPKTLSFVTDDFSDPNLLKMLSLVHSTKEFYTALFVRIHGGMVHIYYKLEQLERYWDGKMIKSTFLLTEAFHDQIKYDSSHGLFKNRYLKARNAKIQSYLDEYAKPIS